MIAADTFVDVLPSALWALVVAFALYLFRVQIRSLLGRVESARLPLNVEVRFRPALEGAAEQASKRLKAGDIELTLIPAKETALLDRAARRADAIVGARALWVDDEPGNNLWEREAIEALGISVTTARSTGEAEFFLERGHLDLVISDMARPGEGSEGRPAGYELRDAMHKYGITVPLIFYVLDLDLDRPPPGRTFAMTNRPDELLDYVIDALTIRRTTESTPPVRRSRTP